MIDILRRKFLHMATVMRLAIGAVVTPALAASDFVVTLPGTGSPDPRAGRMGPSTLVAVTCNEERAFWGARP